MRGLVNVRVLTSFGGHKGTRAGRLRTHSALTQPSSCPSSRLTPAIAAAFLDGSRERTVDAGAVESVAPWKRNKKVAIKPLLPRLTVPHFDLYSPTHHWPSAL